MTTRVLKSTTSQRRYAPRPRVCYLMLWVKGLVRLSDMFVTLVSHTDSVQMLLTSHALTEPQAPARVSQAAPQSVSPHRPNYILLIIIILLRGVAPPSPITTKRPIKKGVPKACSNSGLALRSRTAPSQQCAMWPGTCRATQGTRTTFGLEWRADTSWGHKPHRARAGATSRHSVWRALQSSRGHKPPERALLGPGRPHGAQPRRGDRSQPA